MRWVVSLGALWIVSVVVVAAKAFRLPTYRKIGHQQHLVQQLEEAYENHPFPDYLERLETARAELKRLEEMR